MSKLGMNAKLYFAAAVFTAADAAAVTGASLTVMSNVTDVTLNLETGEANATTRANNGWEATLSTLKNGSVEFEMIWEPADAGFAAVLAAWLASTPIGLVILDGPTGTAGNQGPAGNFSVTNFTRTEPLKEAIKAKVTLKPASQMQWFVDATA